MRESWKQGKILLERAGNEDLAAIIHRSYYRKAYGLLSITYFSCGPLVPERSKPDASGDTVLCMTQLNLSARTYHCILKLARTIADLAGWEEIQSVHLAGAGVAMNNETVNTNAKSNEPAKILICFHFW
jgi:hypothetical protein